MIELATKALFFTVGFVSIYVIAASLLGLFLKTRTFDPADMIYPIDTSDDEIERITRRRKEIEK
jgi:hypothetical protein